MAIHPTIDGLTEKQTQTLELLCVAYAKNGDLNNKVWRDACMKVGYSKNSMGSVIPSMKNNPVFMQRLKDRMKEAAKACNITVEFVLGNLINVYERAMQIKPVKNRKGEFLGLFTFDGRTANRSMELIAKISGIYTDTVLHKNEDFEEAMKKLFEKAKTDALQKSKKYSPEKDPEILAKATRMTESKVIRVREEETYEGLDVKPETIFGDDTEDFNAEEFIGDEDSEE